MDFPPRPLVGSCPRPPLPSRPLHAQATGARAGPPPPLPTSSPQPAQTRLNGQATGAPMETPAPAAPAPLPPPYTVERIFRDFSCRRAALIRALTKDEKEFFLKYNAGAESLHLYGNSDGNWDVRPPKLLLQPEQPDPTMLGVELVRGGDMKRSKWLGHIAMHCDAWLIRISSFRGAHLGSQARKRLSTMMNSLQTVHETYIASDTYRHICHLERMNEDTEDEDEGCGDEPTKCGVCSDRYRANAFWICCDVCDRWFHGKCVNVTAAQAERIGQYECPECYCEKERARLQCGPNAFCSV